MRPPRFLADGPALLRRLAVFLLLCGAPVGATAQGEDPPKALDQAIQEGLQRDRLDRASERRIGQINKETERLLKEYRTLYERLEAARQQNEQLEKDIAAQRHSLGLLQADFSKAETIQRRFAPLLREMAETLVEFVRLDIPFQRAQRLEEAERLLELVERGDLELPEKFRRVMEAYRIEADHNKTIASYPGARLELQGRPIHVELLRVGRLMLYYRSPDGSQSGYWDKQARRWRSLPEAYLPALERALRVARRQAAPELLPLPVPTVPRR